MPAKRIYKTLYGALKMLKGNLNCSEINKYLIRYINFDLKRSDMARVAIHLRNCPKCMEKYSVILKRKNELRKVFIEIEKKLRMQNEISSYIDNECDKESKFITEAMIICDKDYKNELNLMNLIKEKIERTKEEIINNKKTNYTQKILAKERRKKFERIKFLMKIIPLFPRLRREFAKIV